VTAPESTDRIIGSDPVKQLCGLIKIGGKISLVSESPIASNGLGYCFVVVKQPAGAEYSIQAYDEKALRLYEYAMKILKEEVIPDGSSE
jgi:hypothetical protein